MAIYPPFTALVNLRPLVGSIVDVSRWWISGSGGTGDWGLGSWGVGTRWATALSHASLGTVIRRCRCLVVSQSYPIIPPVYPTSSLEQGRIRTRSFFQKRLPTFEKDARRNLSSLTDIAWLSAPVDHRPHVASVPQLPSIVLPSSFCRSSKPLTSTPCTPTLLPIITEPYQRASIDRRHQQPRPAIPLR